jgi:hypothetical protein
MKDGCVAGGQEPGGGTDRVEPDDHEQVQDSGDHNLRHRAGGRHRDAHRTEGKIQEIVYSSVS